MLFNITGKHIEITEAMRAHAQEKTAKFPRYYSNISRVEVVIENVNGGNWEVEIIARGKHSTTLIAKEDGQDVYACIDLAVHKIEKQLRRRKQKQRNIKHIKTAVKNHVVPETNDEEE